MTEKANPSVNRPADAYKTSGAIAYGGHGSGGFIVDGSNPTEIAIQDSGISDGDLDSFAETSSGTSLDVTIAPGEAFVFGSWICIDVSTTVTLASDVVNQEVYVGWNKSGANDVIIGTESEFANSSGDTDEKIPLYTFDTDTNGVTSVIDNRTIGQSPAGADKLSDGTIQFESDDGTLAFEITPNGNVNIQSLQLDGNQLDTDGDGVFDNEDVSGLSNLDSGEAFSAYPISSEDVAADSIGNDEVDNNGDFTFNNEVSLNGGATGLPEPTADADAARKSYVDAIKQGLNIKSSVAVSNHDGNIDLTSTTDPNPVDGYTLSNGERVLLKHQTDSTENGIYVAQTATDPTTWVRASDFDTTEEANQGAFTYVENGTHKNESYVQLTADPVLGTDPIEFSLFSRAGEITAGNQLSKDGETLNVSSNPQFESVNDTNGNTMLNSVVTSGQTTLSDGLAEFSTNISQTDATFMLALGIDDPNADAEVAGSLFWDDSAGNYEIRIRETETSVGNPTVNYDVLRVR
jgi:hypothetical protein